MMEQLSFLTEEYDDPRAPMRLGWNLWHGCTRASTGCMHCYVYRRDESIGKDPTAIHKTESFNLPVRILRSGKYKGKYKVPSGSHIDTCFSSDFFHQGADECRSDAWEMMRERSDCTFFMITKRPERIADHLPADWGDGWEHVTIAVTCENQEMADKRLPIYLELPLRHYAVMIEPMLTAVDLSPYIVKYRSPDGTPKIKLVSAGGESGVEARVCDYDWVLNVQSLCKENGISFYYHQTGAKLIKDGRLYKIPRKLQHIQAHKAGLDI
jgi:protein gp37